MNRCSVPKADIPRRVSRPPKTVGVQSYVKLVSAAVDGPAGLSGAQKARFELASKVSKAQQ